MALKLIVDSIDDVPEAQRGLYEEGQDGKWRLPVEGIRDPESVEKTLATLREQKGAAETRAKRAEQKVEEITAKFEELGDLDQIKEMLAEREKKQVEEAHEKGQLEELHKRQIEKIKADHARELERQQEQFRAVDALLQQRTMKADLAAAVDAAKPVDWLRQHTELYLKDRAVVRRDEDGEYRTYARIGEDEYQPLRDYAQAWVATEEGERFTRGPQTSGAGAENASGSRGIVNPWETGNLTLQGQMLKENRPRALQLQAAAAAKGKTGGPSYRK